VTVYEKSGVASWGPPDYGSGGLDLARIPWEGGPSWWTTAVNGDVMTMAEAAGWAEDTWFPLGNWLGRNDAGDVATYLDCGINVYMSMTHTPNTVTNATSQGMHVLAQANEWTDGEIGSNPLVVGWLPMDEPDLFSTWPAYQTAVANIRAKDDGRFAWTNWAVGPLDIGFFSDQTPAGMNLVDANCIDQYAHTSPTVREHFHNYNGSDPAPQWPGPHNDDAYAERSASYGWLADQMQANELAGGALTPTWVTVETKLPYLGNEPGKDIILYAEMKGAIWSSLIHEARGIMYFDFNGFYDANLPVGSIDPNTGVAVDTGDPAITNCEAALGAYVAPVLNTQSYVFDFGAANIDTMLKAKDGYAYIFAIPGFEFTSGSKTFTVTGSGIGGTNVEVVDEARNLTISGGSFSDTYTNEYDVHIYKVAI
jgi:hypothetical protein